MVQSTFINRRALTLVVHATIIAAMFFIGRSGVSAQSQTCGVGTKVAFEWSPDTVGTIVEIGTESPHVGWFGIKFSWSERIQWAAPESNGLLIAGTKTACLGGKPSSKQTPKTADNSSSEENTATVTRNRETVSPQIHGCPLNEPPGKVTRTSPASAALFKRVMYEKAAVRADPGSITAPSKVGLTFLKFEMGAAFKNTWTSSRFGDKRLHTGAPLNAMLYPIKTTEVLCELYGDKVRRTITEENRTCFKNRDGDWVCPAGGGGKYIESKLIPVQ
ncbi:MAG TPA: hypothetical protein VFZ40_17605 [Pyrinomonadaceae bacterium]